MPLNAIGHQMANRLLSPLPAGLFLLASFTMVLTYPLSTYLRAHKQEPLIWVSILGAVAMALTTWLTARYSTVTGIAWGYLAINLLVLPAIVFVWIRRRSEWHS